MTALDAFVDKCRRQQRGLPKDSDRFFNGVIALYDEGELLLQAYLAYNFDRTFRRLGQLILYESALPGNGTHKGKLDFVFLTPGPQLLVVETKYLDGLTGRTACTRRKEHRAKVIEQAKLARNAIIDQFDLSVDQVECGILTNDQTTTQRALSEKIEAYDISTLELKTWRKSEYERRFCPDPAVGELL